MILDTLESTLPIAGVIIGLPLVLAIFRKFSFLHYDLKQEDILTLKQRYRDQYIKWDGFVYLACIIIIPILTFLLIKGLTIISYSLRPYIAKDEYLFNASSITWLIPSLFLALCFSAIPLHFLLRYLLGKERYEDYMVCGNANMGFSTWRAFIFMCCIIVPLMLAMIGFGMNHHLLITSSGVSIKELFALKEHCYELSDIRRVERVLSDKAPDGQIYRRNNYQVVFCDGYKWESRNSCLSVHSEEKIAEILSDRANIPITIINPYPTATKW